jgi:hypothetical protein
MSRPGWLKSPRRRPIDFHLSRTSAYTLHTLHTRIIYTWHAATDTAEYISILPLALHVFRISFLSSLFFFLYICSMCFGKLDSPMKPYPAILQRVPLIVPFGSSCVMVPPLHSRRLVMRTTRFVCDSRSSRIGRADIPARLRTLIRVALDLWHPVGKL